jgi:hypothetical protein
MEDDRAQVDLGVAVDTEERQEESATLRQPKKRFVGRRQAAEAGTKEGRNGNNESNGAIQRQYQKSFLSTERPLIPLQFQHQEKLLEL